MNFVHKAAFTAVGNILRPWSDISLPPYLTGKSVWYANSPWNVMDLVGGDYTSISAEIN